MTKVKEVEEVKEVEKKVSLAGVRQVGIRWGHPKDGFQKTFETALECAKHFNS
jgi:hypothetical protein